MFIFHINVEKKITLRLKQEISDISVNFDAIV